MYISNLFIYSIDINRKNKYETIETPVNMEHFKIECYTLHKFIYKLKVYTIREEITIPLYRDKFVKKRIKRKHSRASELDAVYNLHIIDDSIQKYHFECMNNDIIMITVDYRDNLVKIELSR